MTCPNCGHSNREGAKFCDNCGIVLPASPAGTISRPAPAAAAYSAGRGVEGGTAGAQPAGEPEGGSVLPPAGGGGGRRVVAIVAGVAVLALACCCIAFAALIWFLASQQPAIPL